VPVELSWDSAPTIEALLDKLLTTPVARGRPPAP